MIRGAFALAVVAAVATWQQEIPVHPLGTTLATSAEPLGTNVTIRELSDGRVLVNDAARQRVLLLDAALKTFVVVIDSGHPVTAAFFSVANGGLIPFHGDSTLMVDLPSNAFAVIDPAGKIARSMALPNAQDLLLLMNPKQMGAPGFDTRGRLIYRVNLRGTVQPTTTGPDGSVSTPNDSAAIVRADFDGRVVDTIAKLKVARAATTTITPDALGGRPKIRQLVNPMLPSDEWAVLPDGSIAIVRAMDYRIDWVGPDGTRSATPKMPYDWRPVTDQDKARLIDSTRHWYDSVRAEPPRSASGSSLPVPEVSFVPIAEIPDFYPAVGAGSVQSDFDGNLWILPRTSSHARGGSLYDVVTRKVEIAERVQLKSDRAVVGFGKGGVVYTLFVEGRVAHLERSRRN